MYLALLSQIKINVKVYALLNEKFCGKSSATRKLWTFLQLSVKGASLPAREHKLKNLGFNYPHIHIFRFNNLIFNNPYI